MSCAKVVAGGDYRMIFQTGKRFTPLSATGASMAPGYKCMTTCALWVRVDEEPEASPSEAVIDSQSVKSAAMVSEQVGFDAGKLIWGRKRFLTVDTLGLVLRVFVTAASMDEREGGKRVLKRVKRMGKAVPRLHTIWVDGGFDGAPFIRWVMDTCRWIVQVVLRPEQTLMLRVAQKTLGGGAHIRLADGVAAISARLRVIACDIRDVNLPCHDSFDGEATGIKAYTSYLFKRPLSAG